MKAAMAHFYPIVGELGLLERLAPLGIAQVQLRIKQADPERLRFQVARRKPAAAGMECG